MKFNITNILVVSILFLAPSAFTQIDTGLESGRYKSDRTPSASKDTDTKESDTKIKYRTKSKKDKKSETTQLEEFTPLVPPSAKKEEVIVINPAPTVIPINGPGEITKVEASSSTTAKTEPNKEATKTSSATLVNPINAPGALTPAPMTSSEGSTTNSESSGFQNFKSILWGDQEITIQAYEEQIHPEDPRLNKLEIDLLPTLYQISSKSGYSLRDYKSNAVAITFSPKFSLTPNFQIQLSYLGSFSGAIPSNVDGVESSVAKFENLEVGFRFKKYYGLSRKANSILYGFDFVENKVTTAADDTIRGRTKSSGINFSAELRAPLTPSYALTSGFDFAPKISHTESSTDVVLRSGSAPEASRVGVKVGGEYKLNRRDQFIWTIRYQVEKNVFSGSATTTDPNSGLKPENVSVEQIITTFSFGYRWGE